MRPDRVVFEASDARGGGRVRSEWPAAALRERGWNVKVTTGWTEIRPGDVVLIHRPLTPEWLIGHPWSPLACLRRYRAVGARVLIDIDDELERIPNRPLSTEQLAEHRAVLAEADGLIVTTRRLETIYGPLARRVWRIPNYLPRWVRDLDTPKDRASPVLIGWAGTLKSHAWDIGWFAPAARAAMGGAVLATVGDRAVAEALGLNGSCVAEPWQGDIRAFYRTMGAVDVGLVPLDNREHREWNEAKSSLKAQEYLALGVPVVATDLPEQRALLEGTGAGLLADSAPQMAEQVQELVHDAALRERMADAALHVRERLWLEDHIDEWLAPIQEVSR